MMNKLSNEDLPANADSVSTDDHKINNTNGELYFCIIFFFVNKKLKVILNALP